MENKLNTEDFTKKLVSFLESSNITKSTVYEAIGMKPQTFYNRLQKYDWTLGEYFLISNMFDMSKIYDSKKLELRPQNSVEEPNSEYRSIKKDTKNVSGSEVEFLRGQIAFLNRQIDRMNETINNLTAK